MSDTPRPEAQLWAEVERYLLMTSARFELVPPSPGTTDKWRAYFKSRPWAAAFGVEMNPAVGVGSTVPVAIENLLRFTERREPIDG